jgi:hypothetical protein
MEVDHAIEGCQGSLWTPCFAVDIRNGELNLGIIAAQKQRMMVAL